MKKQVEGRKKGGRFLSIKKEKSKSGYYFVVLDKKIPNEKIGRGEKKEGKIFINKERKKQEWVLFCCFRQKILFYDVKGAMKVQKGQKVSKKEINFKVYLFFQNQAKCSLFGGRYWT